MCKNALKNSFQAPYFSPHCQNVLSIPRVFARIFTLARSRKSSAFLAKITPDPMSHLVKYLIDQFSRKCPEDFCIAFYDGRGEWCRPFNQGDLLKRLIMDSLWIKKEWVNFWYLIKMSFIGDFQFNTLITGLFKVWLMITCFLSFLITLVDPDLSISLKALIILL